MALNRAINLPESLDKQNRIQAFASVINTMIETCPPIHNSASAQQQQSGFRQPPPQSLVNNMMKIMHKKGLINDLARVPLYMDLSSSKCIDTINTILKPLETMTKTLNISARKPMAATGPKVPGSGGIRLPITAANNIAMVSETSVRAGGTSGQTPSITGESVRVEHTRTGTGPTLDLAQTIPTSETSAIA